MVDVQVHCFSVVPGPAFPFSSTFLPTDKPTRRMRNVAWRAASIGHFNAMQMRPGNKSKRHPSYTAAKSFYGNKIPVGLQLSARHALRCPSWWWCNYYLWLVRFTMLAGMGANGNGSEKPRPRPQEGNGKAWPAFIGIGNQQIKI